MRSRRDITRRGFMKKAMGTAGVISFPYIVQSSAGGYAGEVAASERITVGCVGVGPQGSAVMGNFLAQKDVRVAAVCDVKSNVREAAQNQVNKHYQDNGCAAYNDFRELAGRDDIDVVLAATPDHWHVLVALAAVKAGKDVYLEKPMGLSIEQDQALRAAVHRYGRIFQFGTQQRSGRDFRFACELVRNGRIGKLHTINVWSPGSGSGGSPKPMPAPEWLDYNMWLGPAPFTPYTEDRCSNKLWWYICDYAIGFIAGWGIHPIDIAIWGGGDKLSGLIEIEGKGTWPAVAKPALLNGSDEGPAMAGVERPTEGVCDTALNWNVVCKYESGVTINFVGTPSDGVPQWPQEWQKRYGRTTSHGTAFEGDEGWVHVDREGINAHPKELLTTRPRQNIRGEIHLYESNNHVRNLLDCVKSRAATICPVDEAVQGDALCQISDIAVRLEQKLKWDPVKERFVNQATAGSALTSNEQADRRLTRVMRSPWTL